MIQKSQIDYVAACHAIDLRGHIAGVVGRQEDIDMRQFDRLSRPSQQGFLPEFRQGAVGLSVIQLQRRPDWSRCHSVHANAFLGELLRQTDRETGDCGFCCGIIHQMTARIISLDRGCRNDGASRRQMRLSSLHQPKHRNDVDCERIFDLFQRQFRNGLPRNLLGGIQYKCVQTAQCFEGFIDYFLVFTLIAKIVWKQDSLPAGLLYILNVFFRITFFTREKLNPYIGALSGISYSSRSSYSGIPTGNQLHDDSPAR